MHLDFLTTALTWDSPGTVCCTRRTPAVAPPTPGDSGSWPVNRKPCNVIQYHFISGRIEDAGYTINTMNTVFPVCKMSKICHKSLTPITVTTLLVLSTSFHHGGRKLKSFYGLEGFFFCDSYQGSGKCVCTFVVIDRLVSDVVNHLQHTLFRLRLLIILLLRTAILCATAEESKSPPQPSRCLLWAT